MASRKLKPGEIYDGPKAILTDEDGLTAHYALDKDGEPIARLVQIDLAPDDPDDGSEEYRVAGDDDPVQHTGNVVEFEVDEIHGQASSEA